MNTSKFIMAQKLHRVQEKLMGETISDFSLDGLLPLIFKICSEENLCFWFNFLENECVLNLRDIGHENYELNIRQYYETGAELEGIKEKVLINTFIITHDSVSLEKDGASSAQNEEELGLISGDKPVPKHIRKAIDTIQSKGIPVTAEAIHNHLPLGQMSTSARMECNKYLKQMEGS